MPPRRSARSTKTPTPQELSNSSKRKRTQPTEDKVKPEPNVASRSQKPPSSAKPSQASSGSKVRARASTRSTVPLKEVAASEEEDEEEEEEEEEELPPVKKSRPSPEVEEEEEEDVQPRRGRRPPASKKPTVASRTIKKEKGTDGDAEESRKVQSVSRSRAALQKRASRPVRASSRSIKREPADVSDGTVEDSEIASTGKGSRTTASSTDRQQSTSAALSDEEELVINGRKVNVTASSSKRHRHAGSRNPREESEVPDSEVSFAKSGALSSENPDDDETTVGAVNGDESKKVVEQPEDEETSLLEPNPSTPIPSTSQIQLPPEEPQGPKSRLVIHKMALVNFKSYAGRQEIGPFHKSFSSIVGPNGSGKSNTIDALLFVFGYRASKMRQGKLSELIHNSARYPDLDDCSVEVHFHEIVDLPGPDAFTVVPKSQLVVARQAFKNNSSRYTINGRVSNFTEVQTLLKGRGIDLDHKRFLILQGEVESIAQMKPKALSEHEDGLLEYLEDIIGTSKYKEPIEGALLEMDRLQEDRGEKLNRLRIVEREKNALEDKKKEAEDYLRLQNEHVRALSRLWQWYLWKCLINEEEFEKKTARLEKELAEETERNKDDITHLEMLEQHYQERGELYKEVQAAAAEAVKDLAAHEKQEVGLEERRKHTNGKAKKLKKSSQEDQNAASAAQRTITDSEEKMERERGKLEELEASLDKEEKVLEGIRDSLKDKTQVFHDQIEVKQKELQPWTAKINSQQAEIDVASSERNALAKKAEAVKAACQEAQESLGNLQADQEAKATELDKLRANKDNLQKDLRTAEKKLRDAQALVQELRGKASSSRQKADEARASQAASTSQNKVLESLTKLRNAGRINGFHGRLGSLGTIPDKYDVAISTACGALHNLVVDTVEQGQACIEYLRSQNIGRASFIVLEKLTATKALEKMKTPEDVPRLFDLIKPKEARFLPAFYKGVGNTLVAENLEQANRIAFGGQSRWRVVTLAGQLIDSSGTMSGGGTQVAKGGMSSKLAAESVSPDVLRRYEKESTDATQRLEAALQDIREIEATLETLTRAGPQTDMNLDKLNLDIQNGMKRIAEAEKRVRDLKSQSKPDAGDIARISALDREIEAATEKLETLGEKSGKIENAIKDLEKKILDIGGAKLLTQKSKVDGIRLHINLANDEITRAEVAKAKAEKDSVKLRGTIEHSGAALKEVEAELEELNTQLEECREYVKDLRVKMEAAQAAAENSKDDLDHLKAELDARTEEIQAFRQKEMELKQSLNDTKKEAAENERTLDHWRTEHDKLKLEEIDDDDDDHHEDPARPTEDAEPGEGKVKLEPGDETATKVMTSQERTPSYELHIYSVEELSAFKKREMIADAELLDEKLKILKPNLSVLKEYRKREEEFLKRAKDLEDITNQRDLQKSTYDGLRKQRLDEFMAGFSLISMKLKEMYQMITLGGNAELELVDSMDPFSEGIIFSVMPPKKSWKNISNLSGGEKTLSSLALVFALHVFKPTPLYFMDEIDAALDFRNVSIVANYIKDRTKNAQFIIISLRNDMFELSHRLIGIYKTSNATRSISIDNHALSAIPVN